MAQFKAGDKVRWGALTGVVQYGPYTNALGTPGRYMVERASDGRCCAVGGSDLSLALEIGDRVTVDGLAGTFTLAAGPWRFPREGSGPQYVVTDDFGNAYVESAILVHAAAAPEVGQPRAWRDRSGDIWYPLGEVAGTQRYGMCRTDEPRVHTSTLEEVRETWGPLAPVHDPIPEPTTEGATALDADGDTWYRHGADADGVGRWGMSSPAAEYPLTGLRTWRDIASNFGPMRAAQ